MTLGVLVALERCVGCLPASRLRQENSSMNDTTAIDLASAARYRVTGMDCPACAAKIERAVHSVGLDDVRVSIATQIMTLRAADPKSELPSRTRGCGNRLSTRQDHEPLKRAFSSCTIRRS